MLIPFEVLFAKYNIRPTGVLHLGANAGQEAEEYNKFKIPKVVWVEALPGVYKDLIRHVKDMPGHVALKACIGDRDGKLVQFHVANNAGQSSSILEFGTHAVEHPTVKYVGTIGLKTIRVDTLLKQYKIEVTPGWFLNIDLQGAELMALKGMGDLLRFFTDAYIEVNEKPLYKGCPLVREIDAYLEQWGFIPKEVKMTGAGWGDKYYRKA